MIFQSKSRGGLRAVGNVLTKRGDWIGSGGVFAHNDDDESTDPTPSPIHSLDLTTAPSASNSFDDYGLALPRTVTDYNGRIVEIPADAVPMGGLRPVDLADGQDYGTGVLGFKYETTQDDGVTPIATGGWLDYQPGDTNYADCTHDFSGGADTITLTATGYYTLWLEGTAQITVAAGTATITGAGSATEGSPVTINCTATGTITLTLDNGTLDEWGAYQIIQLNDGTVPTAFIPSTGSATRPAMSPAPTISGLVGTEDARLTVKGLGPNLITNGDFSDGSTGWTVGSAWAIADGVASGVYAGALSYLKSSGVLTIGKKYLFLFDLNACSDFGFAGYLKPNSVSIKTFGSDGISSLGTVCFVATATQRTSIWFYVGGPSGSVEIDNVSIFEIDPTDDTERTIDIDNVDGEFDQFAAIPIKVLSIDVYNDGERP